MDNTTEITFNPCVYVKNSAKFIIKNAKNVSINTQNIQKFTEKLLSSPSKIGKISWAEDHFRPESVDVEVLLRYLFIIDTLNFCFWPNEGYEYFDLAKNLYNAFTQDKSFYDIENLCMIDEEVLKEKIFKCDFCLLGERARMLREVFFTIKSLYNGKCSEFVKNCDKNAVKLVKMIADNFPCFRDNCTYNGCQVFFYKRAQILVSDIHLAYLDIMRVGARSEGNEVMNFSEESVRELTMFADYRVPQILRSLNILEYSAELSGKIDAKIELDFGGKEEVEIRAATVVAVEKIREVLKERGLKLKSIEIDVFLWEEGEKIKDVVKPHHRTRSIFY